MKFWIKKENDADPDIEWNDAYILTLNRDSKSTIYSGLPNIWYHLGQQRMNSIYEDLFVIGLSVFALDKRISRSLFWIHGHENRGFYSSFRAGQMG